MSARIALCALSGKELRLQDNLDGRGRVVAVLFGSRCLVRSAVRFVEIGRGRFDFRRARRIGFRLGWRRFGWRSGFNPVGLDGRLRRHGLLASQSDSASLSAAPISVSMNGPVIFAEDSAA